MPTSPSTDKVIDAFASRIKALATTCAVVIMALANACTSHVAEGSGAADPQVIAGRTYTTDEVFPLATESDLRFEARATMDSSDPAVIHAEVTITNARDARRRIEFQRGCDDVRLRLYASPERTSPPLWDSVSRARPDLAGSLEVFCKGTGGSVMFNRSGSVSPRNFRAEMKVLELKQGSLPEGTYYATAEIKLDAPRMASEIPAGTVVLRRP